MYFFYYALKIFIFKVPTTYGNNGTNPNTQNIHFDKNYRYSALTVKLCKLSKLKICNK